MTPVRWYVDFNVNAVPLNVTMRSAWIHGKQSLQVDFFNEDGPFNATESQLCWCSFPHRVTAPQKTSELWIHHPHHAAFTKLDV